MSGNEYCCKVGRIADKYDISPGVGDKTLDEQLEQRWTGEGEYPEMSLRSLAEWLHKHMMRTRYTENGRSTLEPHLDSDYEVLKQPEDDSYHAVISDLEADDIDGEELHDDFVSAATMYRHLTGCLGVEKSDTNEQSNDDADRKKLEYVTDTAEMYVSDMLSAWENRDDVPYASAADITVRIYLECPECGRQANVRSVRQQGYVCQQHMSAESGPPKSDMTE